MVFKVDIHATKWCPSSGSETPLGCDEINEATAATKVDVTMTGDLMTWTMCMVNNFAASKIHSG
jgi:hypothetical protein